MTDHPPSKDLVSELRGQYSHKSKEAEPGKVIATYEQERFEAADEIDRLNAELAFIRRRTGFWGEVPDFEKPLSETPRTDAAARLPRILADEVVSADFARELERELAEMEEAVISRPFVAIGVTQPPGDGQ